MPSAEWEPVRGSNMYDAGLKGRHKRRLAALNARRVKNGLPPIRPYHEGPRVSDAELQARLGAYSGDAIEALTERRKEVATRVAERTRPRTDAHRAKSGTKPEDIEATASRADRMVRMWGEQGIGLDELDYIEQMSDAEIAEEANYENDLLDAAEDAGEDPPATPLLYH